MLALNTVERECQIAGFTGVIETWRAIWLVAAPAKNQKVCSPSASGCFAKKAGDIVRSDGSFESKEEEESRRSSGSVEPMDVDEISVGSFPSLDPDW